MKMFESMGFDAKTGKPKGLRYREDQGKYWWELRACDYYDDFDKNKYLIQRIAFYARVSCDSIGTLINDSAVFLPFQRPAVLASLNSPIGWYYTFREYPHKKDEAIAMDIAYLSKHPVASLSDAAENEVAQLIGDVSAKSGEVIAGSRLILDWLHHEFGVDTSKRELASPYNLDADAFVAAIRKALPKRQRLSAADIQRLKHEHVQTVQPARDAALQSLALEHKLSDLVNAAYGLTPDDIKLMWDTAPPRMPFTPG
jgi:hypothetical protein